MHIAAGRNSSHCPTILFYARWDWSSRASESPSEGARHGLFESGPLRPEKRRRVAPASAPEDMRTPPGTPMMQAPVSATRPPPPALKPHDRVRSVSADRQALTSVPTFPVLTPLTPQPVEGMRPGPEQGGGSPDLAILADVAARVVAESSRATLSLPRHQGDPSPAALGPAAAVHMGVPGQSINDHPGPARSIALDPDDDAIMDVTASPPGASSSRAEARGYIQARVRQRARENIRRHARRQTGRGLFGEGVVSVCPMGR